MEKKDYIIIVLSIIIIVLIFFIFTGDSELETIIEQIQRQRISLIRSTEIIESELNRSLTEVTQLEADNIKLTTDNTELTAIIDNISKGSFKTDQHLGEYGKINTDFARFIQQNELTE